MNKELIKNLKSLLKRNNFNGVANLVAKNDLDDATKLELQKIIVNSGKASDVLFALKVTSAILSK